MVHSQHTRIRQWARLSIPQSIIHRQAPPIPPQHLHRNHCMTMSTYILVVRTPICGISDPCRTTPAIGLLTCPPQCSLITYTILQAKLCSTPSQVVRQHQRRVLLVLLSPCSTSILLRSFTPSTPIHNRML